MNEPEDGSPVRVAIDGGIARLTLDRPQRRNALDERAWMALESALGRAVDGGARVIVLTGAGDHFSAGADLVELEDRLDDPAAMRAGSDVVQRVQQNLEGVPVATIARLRGACVGGGVGLALCCDLRVAEASARFALTPARLGLHYSRFDTRRLVAEIGSARAREMLLTGDTFAAAEAHRWGLVHRLAEDETALDRDVDALAARLLEASPESVAATKRVLGWLAGRGDDDAASLDRLFADSFTGADFREGARAFRDKRTPRFRSPGTDNGKEDA